MNLVQFNKDLFQVLKQTIIPLIYQNDLKKLGVFYGTKWGDPQEEHLYAQHYEKHFAPLKRKKLKILEIGIGGYDNPTEGGESLRLWKTYFPNSMIYGIDIIDKRALEEDRIKIFQGSQDDEDFLRKVLAETGEIDIIIDDGSHINEHVIKSFKTLFPALKHDGIYVVEDTHTSEPNIRKSLLGEFREEDLPHNTYYGDGSPIEKTVLDEIRAVYQQETIIFPWQAGDILMLDNMLAAHGRMPFVGQRKVVVGMAE